MPGHVRTAETNGVNAVAGPSSLHRNYRARGDDVCKRKQRRSTASTRMLCARIRNVNTAVSP